MKFNINKTNVGNRILNIRNSLNLTLEQFGNIEGINAERSNVSKWERGSSLPNRARLEVIAKLGKITVNELLYGSTEEFLKNNLIELINDIDNTGYLLDALQGIHLIQFTYWLNKKIDINNIEDVQTIFESYLHEFIENRKSENFSKIAYLKKNKKLTLETYNILRGGNYFSDLALDKLNKNIALNENNQDFYDEKDINQYYNDFSNIDDFFNIYNDDIEAMKYFYLLDDFYLNVKNKEQNFKGNYDNLNFLNMDFNYFLKLKNKYKINDFLDYDTETDFYIDAEMYTIPYKPNKYKITNFKEIIGLYIIDLDTTYFLANYSSSEDVPLNTEAEYFILKHDNSYQITKITEIPDCKYIAPIIGRLE